MRYASLRRRTAEGAEVLLAGAGESRVFSGMTAREGHAHENPITFQASHAAEAPRWAMIWASKTL